MARFANDPFPGTDYTQYKSWPPVMDAGGNIIGYQLPNHPNYIYDEVASNATGRKVFRQNPKGEISKQQEVEALQKKAIEQQQFNQSPTGQLLPIVAGTAGTIAAANLIPAAADPLSVVLAEQAKAQMAQQALQTGAGQVAATLPGAAAQGAAQAAAPVAASATAIPGAAAGAGNYIPGLSATQTVPAAVAPEATGLSMPAFGSVGALPLAAIAASTYLGGQAGLDMIQGKKPGLPGRVILGMATGGLSEVANAFMQPSTRDIAKKHTKELLGASDDQNYQNYVSGMREQYNSAPPDPSKPFAGKYSTFEEYKKGGLEAADLEGVYGNIKTYGAEWANMTPEQRRAVTQANIDSGLYNSKKGEVEITDQQKAIENKNNVLKGFNAGVQTAANPAVSPQAQAAAQGAIIPPKVAITGMPAGLNRPSWGK